MDHPIRISWEGAFFNRHSLAHVNRELCLRLLASGQVDLSILPTEPPQFDPVQDPRLAPLAKRINAPLAGPAHVHVRHCWPPRLDPPPEGAFVLIQPWEFGSLPLAWIEPIKRHVAEVWCYSSTVREVYLAAGIPAERLHLLPLGIDPAVFHPAAAPYPLTADDGRPTTDDIPAGAGGSGSVRAGMPLKPGRSGRDTKAPVQPAHSKAGAAPPDLQSPIASVPIGVHLRSSAVSIRNPFVFLFAGGTIHRKGIDILLQAYLRAFSACDDVLLVIKDTGTRTVYAGQNAREQILALAQDPTRPRIVYLDADLSAQQLAGLYTAADCGVFPYRGEGFCLPALEMMGCGRPVVVTAGGPTDDFVDETAGWRLPAERRFFECNRVGDLESVGRPWLFEPSVDTLAALLRDIYRNPTEAAHRGAAAALRALDWSWERTAGIALQRIEALGASGDCKLAIAKCKLQIDPVPTPYAAASAPATPATAIEHPASSAQHPASTVFALSRPFAGVPAPRAQRSKSESPTPLLSLCMIVRNEERVLADCVASVKPFVDEMIVVDTGSTDRTVEIAERFGAKVIRIEWPDSFAAARNESLKHATGRWILWVDADDTLPRASGEAIRAAALAAPAEVAGFVIPVQFVEDGTPAGGTRVDHVKLFRNLPGLAFEGRIHEQIIGSLRAQGGQIARLNAVVLHSGYDTSPEGQAKKRARDKKLLDLELAERPDCPFVPFCVGMTAHYNHEHEAAVQWLSRSIALAEAGESHVRKAYALMAVSQRELGQAEASRQTLERGLAVVPGDPELHFHAALAMTVAGRLPEAKAHYLETLKADVSGFFSSFDVGILGYKTFHNLAGVCMAMGDYPDARSWWLKAVEAAPQFLPSAFELFNASLARNDRPTAQQMMEAVRHVEGFSENWANMVVRYAGGDEGRQTTDHRPPATDGVLDEAERGTGSGHPPAVPCGPSWGARSAAPVHGPSPAVGRAEELLQRALTQDPAATGARLVLARRLLQAERVQEAHEHLLILNEAGVAEAAYCLGVYAIRRGDFREALAWMERAHALNPAHPETREQIANLNRALAEAPGELHRGDAESAERDRSRNRGWTQMNADRSADPEHPVSGEVTEQEGGIDGADSASGTCNSISVPIGVHLRSSAVPFPIPQSEIRLPARSGGDLRAHQGARPTTWRPPVDKDLEQQRSSPRRHPRPGRRLPPAAPRPRPRRFSQHPPLAGVDSGGRDAPALPRRRRLCHANAR